MIRVRAIAPLVAAAVAAAAACGGENVTATVTETETVTETVAPEGPDDRAFQLAQDVCDALPRGLVASFLGVDPQASEQLADEFASLARPELRDAARDGCLHALEAEGG